MLMMMLALYVTLSLGAGFLMWAMCRMAATERPVYLEVDAPESDGLVAPTAVAY